MSRKSLPESFLANNLTRGLGLYVLRQMWEIRMFEDRACDLLGRNVIKGASHLNAGQEAAAVGASPCAVTTT